MASNQNGIGIVARCAGAVRAAACAVCVLAMPAAAHAADTAVKARPPAAAPVKIYSTVLFGGFDYRKDSYYGYGGIVAALNGNIATDGFLVRAMGLYNPYRYTSTAVAGGIVDGKMSAGEAMIGYQKYFPGVTARLFVGVDYEHHKLSPANPLDRNNGTHWGVHARGELDAPYLSQWHYNLHGSYGSATRRYWVRGRAGYNFAGVIVGPEGLATGNWVSNEQRVGGFLMFRSPQLAPFEVSFSGGYSQTDNTRGGKSGYGTVELSVAF
jgi:hypothetical protein